MFHVIVIYLHEVFKIHGKIGLLRLHKMPLPFLRFSLELEAAFLTLTFSTGIVSIITFDIPGLSFFVLIDGHVHLPFILAGPGLWNEGEEFTSVLLGTVVMGFPHLCAKRVIFGCT